MNLLRLLRPYQWIKNLLVFVPIIFARELFDTPKLAAAIHALVAFSLIASAGYVFNDILDRRQDKKHPQKSKRPIAASKISLRQGWLTVGVLAVLGGITSWLWLPSKFWLVIVIYAALNIFYSVYLKRVAVLDLLLIVAFYLLRVIGGGVATNTFISEWLVLVMAVGAFLLIVGKRQAELTHDHPRAVVLKYTPAFLNQLLTIAASLTIITYSLYTILGAYSDLAIYSVVFVLLGVLRYLQLVNQESVLIEYPEKVLVKDKALLIALIGWAGYMVWVLYGLGF